MLNDLFSHLGTELHRGFGVSYSGHRLLPAPILDALCLQMHLRGPMPHSHLCPPTIRARKQPLWKNLHEAGRKKWSAKSSLSKALQTVSFHIAESVNQGIAPRVLLH